jgi:tetratricopeptide (TPR) repeat protein
MFGPILRAKHMMLTGWVNGGPEFARSHFQPETAIRGGISTDNSNEVVTLYLSGNYEQGIQKADSLLVTQPHNIQLLFFKGLLATELNHSDQASQLFLQVIPEGGSYEAFARWYLALNYLKKGNFTACREQLALLKKMEDHPYEKQIGKLYRRLRFLKNQ